MQLATHRPLIGRQISTEKSHTAQSTGMKVSARSWALLLRSGCMAGWRSVKCERAPQRIPANAPLVRQPWLRPWPCQPCPWQALGCDRPRRADFRSKDGHTDRSRRARRSPMLQTAGECLLVKLRACKMVNKGCALSVHVQCGEPSDREMPLSTVRDRRKLLPKDGQVR